MTQYLLKEGSLKVQVAQFTCENCDAEFLSDSFESVDFKTGFKDTCPCCRRICYTESLQTRTRAQLSALERVKNERPTG